MKTGLFKEIGEIIDAVIGILGKRLGTVVLFRFLTVKGGTFMFGIIAAVSTLVAEVSGAIATASVPMLGGIVTAGAKGIGTAVGSAVSNSGGSAIAGTLAANSTQTMINGAAIGIAKGIFD